MDSCNRGGAAVCWRCHDVGLQLPPRGLWCWVCVMVQAGPGQSSKLCMAEEHVLDRVQSMMRGLPERLPRLHAYRRLLQESPSSFAVHKPAAQDCCSARWRQREGGFRKCCPTLQAAPMLPLYPSCCGAPLHILL